MHDDAEHDPGPRVINASVPEWAKFAGSIIGTLIVVLMWVESRFVSRIEWQNHLTGQSQELAEIKNQQASYATAERVTATGVYSLQVDVAEIKNDVSWLRAYLDVSKPLPKKK